MTLIYPNVSKCSGLAGKLFGHAFISIYNYGPSQASEIGGKWISGSQLVSIIKASRSETFLGLYCERCGAHITPEEYPNG